MRKINIVLFTFLFLLVTAPVFSQSERWQQRVNYRMDIRMDVEANRFAGKQRLEYSNNSPDTLKKVFYHLYWNAFQPNSMMDARSRVLGSQIINGRNDWDPRVQARIQNLKPDEIGFQKILTLKMNGRPQKTSLYETILKVDLDKPILPHSKVVFEMEFEAQVPVQIRRSGRDNAEGVRFSMAQWYPKLCEYDQEGWHPTPYVAREFYGVWGDFEVNITIDRNYIIAATGYLQNPTEIGYGYEPKGAKVVRPPGKNLTWHFIAPNVHDFVWAADPDYHHETRSVRDGMILHAFYKIDTAALGKQFQAYPQRIKQQLRNDPVNFVRYYQSQWEEVLDLAAKALPYMDKTFGKYPYKQYSFIQGGDGGMEYPMATLLKGAGAEVVIHEWMHSWYQMMLGTNESLYPWMDEGFTSYAETRILNHLEGDTARFPHQGAYNGYFMLAKSDYDEPLTTHSDQYSSNFAYSINSYSKGEVFLEQLGYIVGASNLDKILLAYYNKWRFKHPAVADFIRVAEEVSGVQLDWYRTFFVNTTKTIDYGIDSLWEENGKLNVRLVNKGKMPMPLDVVLTFKDGSREIAYIPQYLMFGGKPNEEPSVKRVVLEPWKWTLPDYTMNLNHRLLDLKSIEIDPSRRMADIDRSNNRLELAW